MWYNYDALSLEPGRASFLLIENRIPNNRYVPVVACAGRATWLMQPDRRIATGGCAMTASGGNDTSVRSRRRTRQGVRRPWRQPATVRLLWLHMVLAGTVRPSGKMIIKSDLTVMENRACNIHTYRSANTAERERVFFKRSLRQGTVFFRNGFHRGGVVSKHDHAKGEVYPSG